MFPPEITGSEKQVDLTIVVPAYNEGATVAGVIDNHVSQAQLLGATFEILAVDDGSSDDTSAQIAAVSSPHVRWWRHASNAGIASTLLELYRESTGTWVYYVPADAQIPAAALGLLWAMRGECLCVVGRRSPRQDPIARRAIAWTYSIIVRRLFGIDVHDIDSVKLIQGSLLRDAPIRSKSSFAEAELLVYLQRHGAILEIPIPHDSRRFGKARGVTPKIVLSTAIDLVRSLTRLRL